MANLKQVRDPDADNGWLVFDGPVKIHKNGWGDIEGVSGNRVGSYWKSPWKSEWLAKHHGETRVFRSRTEAKMWAFEGPGSGASGEEPPMFEGRDRTPSRGIEEAKRTNARETVRITRRQLRQIIRETIQRHSQV